MRLWLTICAVLVFAAGCTVGMLLSSDRFCGRGCPDPAPTEIASDATAAESVVASMVDPYPDYPLYLVSGEDVYDELGLEEEQRRKVEELFAKHFEDIGEVRRGMAKVAAELRDGVLGVLTPEQEIRFNQVQRRYSENKTRSYVGRELAELREEVNLRPEQEPAVYRYLYDAATERQAAYLEKPRDDSAIRKRVKLIYKKLDERLKERVLFADQFAAYLKFQERRSCVKKKEGHRDTTAGKDCAPSAVVPQP